MTFTRCETISNENLVRPSGWLQAAGACSRFEPVNRNLFAGCGWNDAVVLYHRINTQILKRCGNSYCVVSRDVSHGDNTNSQCLVFDSN